MLVLDGRYAVGDGEAGQPEPGHDLLLDRPVTLVRLTDLPASWRGERAARALRTAARRDGRHVLLDIGVAPGGLFLVLAPTSSDTSAVGPPCGVQDASPFRHEPDAPGPVPRRTVLAAASAVFSVLALVLASDGLLG